MAGTDPILDVSMRELRGNRGIAYGEVHNDLSNPEWLAAHMRDFRASGVGTFFVEMLNAADQPLLDRFNRGDASVDLELRAHLFARWESRDNRSAGSAEAYFTMFRAARDQGISIVAIDAEPPAMGADRLAYANPAWANTITNYLDNTPDAGKFLVLAGRDHTARRDYMQTSRYLDGGGKVISETERTPPGIDALLDIPSIDFNAYRADRSRLSGTAPAAPVIAAGDGNDNSYEAALPVSSNQRDTGGVAAPAYRLPAEIMDKIGKIAGLPNLNPQGAAGHGAALPAPSSTPVPGESAPSNGR